MIVNKRDCLSRQATGNGGMKFSHKPYVPFAREEEYAVYVTRIAPCKNGVFIAWRGDESDYTVKVYEKDKEILAIWTAENRLQIDGLQTETEYSFTVCGQKAESARRLFVTGDYRGEVIQYLHPQDLQYAYSGRYLATPSIVRFQGDLYVLTDVFRGSDQTGAFNLSILYRSEDNGKTWEYVCELVPCFWGTLFVAGDKLCVLACTTEGGSLIVASSENGDEWSDPTYLLYGAGERSQGGPHRTASAYCEYDGRLYFSVEFGGHCIKRFDSMIASLDLRKDPLEHTAWTFSETCAVQFEWGGDQNVRFAIEGNTVERNGKIYNLLRFFAGKALMLEYDPQDLKRAPRFYKTVDIPLGHCKFFLQRAKDGCYYAMGNHACYPRQRVELYRSDDLETWEKVKDLIDVSYLAAETNGVQYPSFVLEGNKFYTVLRTGLNGANTFHDTNAITFNVFDVDEIKNI